MSHPVFCPFCGGELTTPVYGEGHWSAISECLKCDLVVDTTYGDAMGGSFDSTITYPRKKKG